MSTRGTGSAAAARNEPSGHKTSQCWGKEQLNKDHLSPCAVALQSLLGADELEEMWENSQPRHVAVF